MLKGSCLCQGMRFEITGTHSKVGICHCSLCRKTSGTGSSAAIVVAYDQLTWLAGQELVTSGPKHSFCRVCGAHAPDSNPRKTVYVVPVGVLDGNPNLLVGQHIYDSISVGRIDNDPDARQARRNLTEQIELLADQAFVAQSLRGSGRPVRSWCSVVPLRSADVRFRSWRGSCLS